jgi:hypothetical protein
MKLIRIVPLLFFVMNSTQVSAQKYHVSGAPIDGYFYVDSTFCKQHTVTRNSNKCVNIVSDNKTVISSGRGNVIYCYPHADKTSEIGIKYGPVIVIYANIINRKVYKNQFVDQKVPIGELVLNPKDKKYHLGLQVVKADDPNEVLWGNKLAHFLNASQVLFVDAR